MGGSIPIGDIFRRRLGIETVFFSFSTGDEEFHAPNEFFRPQSFRTGLTAWARALEVLGQRLTPTRPCPFSSISWAHRAAMPLGPPPS
jgi:hypothetical protein